MKYWHRKISTLESSWFLLIGDGDSSDIPTLSIVRIPEKFQSMDPPLHTFSISRKPKVWILSKMTLSGAHHGNRNAIAYTICQFATSKGIWMYNSTSQPAYESSTASWDLLPAEIWTNWQASNHQQHSLICELNIWNIVVICKNQLRMISFG